MNTGQFLASISSLPSGSALAHLTAIAPGAGQGATIFAERMTVIVEPNRLGVTTSSAKHTLTECSAPSLAISRATQNKVISTVEDAVCVYTEVPGIQVTTGHANAWIHTTRETV